MNFLIWFSTNFWIKIATPINLWYSKPLYRTFVEICIALLLFYCIYILYHKYFNFHYIQGEYCSLGPFVCSWINKVIELIIVLIYLSVINYTNHLMLAMYVDNLSYSTVETIYFLVQFYFSTVPLTVTFLNPC